MGGYTCFSRYFYSERGGSQLGGMGIYFVSLKEGATNEVD
jgi:hypothetical protein